MSQLKLIVCGLGLIGPRHAEQIAQNKETELIAFIDPSPKAQLIADQFNVPLYSSLTELLNAGLRPDAAYVCTPNALHVSVALELANEGIHILVEKPISTKVEDAIALKDCVESKGVKLLVGHHRRFNPYILATKKHLSKLGAIIAVDGVWTLKKNDTYFKQVYWRNVKSLGGGPILINLVHDLDLLQYLMGPIKRVYAEKLSQHRDIVESDDPVDEGAVLTLSFKSGAKGTFIVSDNVISPFNFEMGTGENPLIPKVEDPTDGVFYRIFGTKGTLTVPDFHYYHQNDLKPGLEKGWWEPLHKTVLEKDISGIPFALQLDHFVKYVRGEEDAKCTITDGISALLVIEAIMESLESGAPRNVKSVSSFTSFLKNKDEDPIKSFL